MSLPPAALDFASRLGPYSSDWIQGEGELTCQGRIDEGREVCDAVLGSVFDGMGVKSQRGLGLSGEFWGFLYGKLRRLSSLPVSPHSRDDVLQSAIGSVLVGHSPVEFRTQAEFLGFLAQRIRWKRDTHARRGYQYDVRLALTSVEGNGGAGTATKVAGEEAANEIHASIRRLSSPDQTLVLARLAHASRKEALVAIGRNDDAGRQAMCRAIRRLGRIVDPTPVQSRTRVGG